MRFSVPGLWSIFDFPTVAGDGTTNDSTALGAVFTQVGINGGTLIVPGGKTYRIGTNLTCPANVQLQFMYGAAFSIDTGVTFTYLGPQLKADRHQIFNNALASQGAVSFVGNGQLECLYPEWWGAKADVGLGGISGTDSTAAIQACFDAAHRSRGDYTITSGVLTSGQRNHFAVQAPYIRNIKFASLGAYLITDTINLTTLAGGIIDGCHCIICWNGPPTNQMFRLQDCREVHFKNFFLLAHQDHPAMAAFTTEHNGTFTPHITPTNNRWENITVRGNAGGFTYGWRMMIGAQGDNNNEFHSFIRCNCYDFSETAWSIEHSQSKAIHFYDCNFNALNTITGNALGGRRGVSLRSPGVQPQGNGSFYWFGGSGGGVSVAAFEVGVPLESTHIVGANLEHCARLITTPFNEVITGLYGSVPSPVSLTMTTPAGSAYVGSNAAVTAGGAFTYTYPTNKDTYDDLQIDGSIVHTSVNNGASVPVIANIGAAMAARLQKVVTNGTQITAVLFIGGSYANPSFNVSPCVVESCRISTTIQNNVVPPYSGELAAWMQAGSLILIGNRFKQIGGGGGAPIVRFRYLRGHLGTQDSAKIISLGNVFVDTDQVNPTPNWESRLLPTDTDGSESGTDMPRVISFCDSFTNQGSGGPTFNTDVPKVQTSWLKATLAGVNGLSGTQVPGRNLSGQVVISDTNVTAAVTFAITEDDASYRVLLGTMGSVGAVVGSATVDPGSLATSGFTVRLSTAPTAGKTVTVWWMIVR